MGTLTQGFADFKQGAYDFGMWTHPIMTSTGATVNVNNYFASTGNTIEDGKISAAIEKEQLNAAQATSNRALGGNGGSKYK